jgi:hypothetical protein
MELGAPSAAAQVLGPRTDPGVCSRVAGQRLRWVIDIPSRSPDPRHRFDDVDPALARLDALPTRFETDRGALVSESRPTNGR